MGDERSIPDLAAELLWMHNGVTERLGRLKAADKDMKWTRWQMAINEATGMAREGLRQSWSMLDRLDGLLRELEDTP